MVTYELKITFWNEDNKEIKEISLITSYPTYEEVEETLYDKNLNDFKSDGGKFDFFEITEKKIWENKNPVVS
jgi:hypothetical protein